MNILRFVSKSQPHRDIPDAIERIGVCISRDDDVEGHLTHPRKHDWFYSFSEIDSQ